MAASATAGVWLSAPPSLSTNPSHHHTTRMSVRSCDALWLWAPSPTTEPKGPHHCCRGGPPRGRKCHGGCLAVCTSQPLHKPFTTPHHGTPHYISLSHLSLISLISLSHIAVAFLSCISHSRISRSRISRSHISLSCISLSLISLSYLSLWYLFVFVISVSHLSLMACRMARVLAVDGAVARAVCSLWARRPQQDPLNSFSFSRCGLYLSTILLPGQINTISLLLWPCYRFHIGITPNS